MPASKPAKWKIWQNDPGAGQGDTGRMAGEPPKRDANREDKKQERKTAGAN